MPVRPGHQVRPASAFVEHDDVGDLVDEAETEPPLDYYRRRAVDVRYQLEHEPPADPVLLGRLQRDLRAWEQLAEQETRPGHFESGEGDRRLF